MLKMCSKAELAELENDGKEGDKATEQIVEMSAELKEKAARRARLKQKIISLGRMNIMLGNLRENSEVILKMKQVSLDGKLPRGLLLKEKSSIKFDLEQFERTRELDAQNEKRPKKQPRSTKTN
jgi:serine/threonine-protein phosphatase 2B catalytic subunit